jgi:hypothetical protein
METAAAEILAGSSAVAAAVLPGSVMLRNWQRRHYDHMRRVYQCHFPAEFDNARVVNFLRAVAGLPLPRPGMPAHTLVFDVYGDVTGIRFFLSIPGHVVAEVESWFRSHIVGGSLTMLKPDPLDTAVWDRAREVKTSSINHMLDMKSPDGSLVTLLSGFSSLGPDEAALMQIVILPAHFREVPETPPEAKAKLAERNFLTLARIAARGERAEVLINRLYANLTHMDNLKMRVTYRSTRSRIVKERIRLRSGTLIYPSTLNIPELSVLVGFPFGAPNVAGLPRGRARHLPPDYSIPAVGGAGVGFSSFPGLEDRRLAIPFESLMMHEYVLGPTGTGKSTLLQNQVIDVAKAGYGVIVIEPKGDLCLDILRTLPPERAEDVIWFDPTERANPVGFNVLAGNDPEQLAGHIVSLFKSLFSDSWGPRLEDNLRIAVATAAYAHGTLVDVKQLLIDPDYRDKILRTIKDRPLRAEWLRMGDLKDIEVASAVNKLNAFVGLSSNRNIVGQLGGLSVRDVVRGHKILLAPLRSAVMGERNAEMMGALLFDQIWNEIRQRPQDQREPVVSFLDEWHHYVRQATISVEDMFAEARSYKLGLVVANQHVGQLKDSTLQAVKANARTKIVFGLDHDNAEKLHKEFAPLGANDLQTLGQYEIAAQLMTATGAAPVATALTAPPPKAIRSGNAIRQMSASKYGRPVHEVEAELAARYQSTRAERKRPEIGTVEDL